MDSREAFIALNMIEGVGPVRTRSLLEYFGEAPKTLAASRSELTRVRNIGEDLAEKIVRWEQAIDLAGEIKRIQDYHCHVLIQSDEDYPPLLREIYDPPIVNHVTIHKILNHGGVLLALSISLLLSCLTASGQSLNHAAPQVGDPPPPLQFAQISQGPALNQMAWEKLKGKIVVLEFWDTACVPCVEAIPHLNDLVEQFRDEPVVFLSVSDDNPDRLKQFLRKRPIQSWLAIDGAFDPTRRAFGVTGIPTTFLIGRSGKIEAVTHPAVLEAKHLQELLDGKPSSLPKPQVEKTTPTKPQPSESTAANEPSPPIAVSMQGPFPPPDGGAFNFRNWNKNHTVFNAKRAYLQSALASLFGVSEKMVIPETTLADHLYDFSASAPTTNDLPQLRRRFAEMLATNLGLNLVLTNHELDVYTMSRITTNAPRLVAATKPGGGGQMAGGFLLHSSSMDDIASYFEIFFGKPVINETQATASWDVDIKWKMSEAELLPDNLDDAIWRQVRTNSAAIISGNLPRECQDKISPHDLKLLQSELAKPDDQRFQPAATNIIAAARDELGLEIKPAKRRLQVVLIRAAK
ncbi:MAG TPA: TIGR03435 family protein [Verrucomicrobiae bacterium]